jgi:hypothetical protein
VLSVRAAEFKGKGSLEVELDGSDVEVHSQDLDAEWAFDPAQRSDVLEKPDLPDLATLELPAFLEGTARVWALEDGHSDTVQAQAARELTYQKGLTQLLEQLRAGQQVRTKGGKLAFGGGWREALSLEVGYSLPVVRGWLRDLEARLAGLRDDRELFAAEVTQPSLPAPKKQVVDHQGMPRNARRSSFIACVYDC